MGKRVRGRERKKKGGEGTENLGEGGRGEKRHGAMYGWMERDVRGWKRNSPMPCHPSGGTGGRGTRSRSVE